MRHPSLATLAELSSFKQTGGLAEVDALCSEFAVTWPEAVRCFEYGRSSEGRGMRALLVSRSSSLTAAELRAHRIPLLMIQGGIHPGESDGKDAGFIALRELLEGPAALLHEVALLFVPAFNVDGHERVGRWGRPNQNGPEETGWRTTAQNLNLNRDYMKADTPEMRAMLHLIDEWDPLICADLHVTDGADFEPDVSIQAEPVNQGDMNLRVSGRQLRDALIAYLAECGSLPLHFYPDLSVTDDPTSGFALTVYSPRFSTGYFPQRNRFTVLVETHSWKDYATRVGIMRKTIIGLTELVTTHGTRWLELAQQADAVATTLSGSELALDYATKWREPAQAGGTAVARNDPGARLIDFRGYAYTRRRSAISGDLVTVYDPTTPHIWRVPLRDTVTPSLVVTVPSGFYIVPISFAPDIAERLDAHGIDFEWLAAARTALPAEVFRADTVTFSTTPFEGRMRASVQGVWALESTNLLAGALVVPVAQRLSRLVLALLEPQAPDSFAAWGFFNSSFEQKEHMEPYVAEQIAQRMLDQDAALAAEFGRLLAEDAAFAASPSRRLEFFLRRHASWDARYNVYPVLRATSLAR